MTTLNISLPDPMREFVESQVADGGYGTASEYVRDLIRDAQKQVAKANLEQMLLDGLHSGPPIKVNDEYWERKRARLTKSSSRTKRRK